MAKNTGARLLHDYCCRSDFGSRKEIDFSLHCHVFFYLRFFQEESVGLAKKIKGQKILLWFSVLKMDSKAIFCSINKTWLMTDLGVLTPKYYDQHLLYKNLSER